MNLQKAIELLKQLSIPGTEDLLPDDFDAIKLGIEALKRIVSLRRGHDKALSELLPGETNEGTARGCRALLT